MKTFLAALLASASLASSSIAQRAFHFSQEHCGIIHENFDGIKAEKTFREFVLKRKGADKVRSQSSNTAIHVWQFQTDRIKWFDFEPYMKNAIDALNTHFSSVGISFYVKFYSKINSDKFYNFRMQQRDLDDLRSTFNVDNAINLYLVGNFCQGTCPTNPYDNYVHGFAASPFNAMGANLGNEKTFNWIMISTADLEYVRQNIPGKLSQQISQKIFHTFPHEFGHYFNLYHTFSDKNEKGEYMRPLERVDGSNCTAAGDYVCDTPADPVGGLMNVADGKIANCEFSSLLSEPGTGKRYKPMINNMMSYFFLKDYFYLSPQGCDKLPIFTTGQYDRMVFGKDWRLTTHPDPSKRYYLDGQNHFSLGTLSLQQNRNQEISRCCVGTPVQIAWYRQGSPFFVDYKVEFINETTNRVDAQLSNLYIDQDVGEFVRFTVPTQLQAGKYKIKVTSTRDGISDDSKTLEVQTTNSAQLAGEKTIYERESAALSLTLTGSLPAQFTLTSGISGTADKTPFAIDVKPTQTTIYSLTSVSNVCGTGTVTPGSVKITVVPITATEPQASASVRVYPNPAVEQLTVRFEQAGPYKLKWLNATGQVLTEVSGSGNEATLAVNNPPGMYLLWTEQRGKSATFRVVKK